MIDFGIAADLFEKFQQVPATQGQVGTYGYMPPEQHDGRPPDKQSDVFALGATMFELLTGEVPPIGTIVLGAPQLPATSRVPPGVQEVLDKALQPDPMARFWTMKAFAEAIRAVPVDVPASPRGGPPSTVARPRPTDTQALGEQPTLLALPLPGAEGASRWQPAEQGLGGTLPRPVAPLTTPSALTVAATTPLASYAPKTPVARADEHPPFMHHPARDIETKPSDAVTELFERPATPPRAERERPASLLARSPLAAERPSPYNAERPSPYNAERPSPHNAERPSPYNAERPSPYNAERPSPHDARRLSPHMPDVRPPASPQARSPAAAVPPASPQVSSPREAERQSPPAPSPAAAVPPASPFEAERPLPQAPAVVPPASPAEAERPSPQVSSPPKEQPLPQAPSPAAAVPPASPNAPASPSEVVPQAPSPGAVPPASPNGSPAPSEAVQKAPSPPAEAASPSAPPVPKGDLPPSRVKGVMVGVAGGFVVGLLLIVGWSMTGKSSAGRDGDAREASMNPGSIDQEPVSLLSTTSSPSNSSETAAASSTSAQGETATASSQKDQEDRVCDLVRRDTKEKCNGLGVDRLEVGWRGQQAVPLDKKDDLFLQEADWNCLLGVLSGLRELDVALPEDTRMTVRLKEGEAGCVVRDPE